MRCKKKNRPYFSKFSETDEVPDQHYVMESPGDYTNAALEAEQLASREDYIASFYWKGASSYGDCPLTYRAETETTGHVVNCEWAATRWTTSFEFAATDTGVLRTRHGPVYHVYTPMLITLTH